jgi:hypothetical protein
VYAIECNPRTHSAIAMFHDHPGLARVMVPHMFCLPGMTSYRALFDVLGVPYAGSLPGTMALGARKAHARAVAAAATGLPWPLRSWSSQWTGTTH